MINVQEVNAPFIAKFRAKLDIAPGRFRDDHPDELFAMIQEVDETYNGIPDRRDAGLGLNNLAFTFRRLGYGHEAFLFADRSNTEFTNNAEQKVADQDLPFVIANMGFMAYAAGMIDGDYDVGLKMYREIDSFLKDRGAYDATAQIKSAQNAGQILHRKGMLQHEFYEEAVRQYKQAEEALAGAQGLNGETRTQFQAQIDYCMAKTLAHQVRINAVGRGVVSEADMRIKRAIQAVSKKAGFDFEKACFLAVQGKVYAAKGEDDFALGALIAARGLQIKHGRTLMSRICAVDVEIARQTRSLPNNVPLLLQGFYGKKGHPDLIAYDRMKLTLESGGWARFIP